MGFLTPCTQEMAPAASVAAVHDGRVKLMGFRAGIYRTAPGIEQRAILQHGNGQCYRIQRRSTFGKRIPSSLKNDAQRSPVFTFRLDGKSIAVDGARTAMNGQNRICHTVLHEW